LFADLFIFAQQLLSTNISYLESGYPLDAIITVFLIQLDLLSVPLTFESVAVVDWVNIGTLFSVMLLGLVFSALFSSAEVAFFSLSGNLSPDDIEESRSDVALKRVLGMLDKPRRLLSTILIGNTVANIISAVMAAVITGQLLVIIDIPDYIVYAIEIIVLTSVIVILSEITPKILALKNPKGVAKALSGFLYIFYVLLAPLAKGLGSMTAFLEKRLPKPVDKFSSDDLRTIAEVGELQGSLEGDEREIIENVIEFGNTTVKEIMTSRVDIIAISTKDTLVNVLETIRERSVSRMPLYETDLDNIVGIIHTKDLLPFIDKANQSVAINWKSLARKTIYIPPSKKLDDLLRDFQREKTHVAIVVDEYGGTDGIVSLDDILEEIIGEMHDEYSGQEVLFTRKKNGDYIFDAKIDLDDLGDILGVDIVSDDDEYETLGGLIYHILERIPNIDETLDYKGLKITVSVVENNRITKVIVKSPDSSETKETE
jgi:putative hemolysin